MFEELKSHIKSKVQQAKKLPSEIGKFFYKINPMNQVKELKEELLDLTERFDDLQQTHGKALNILEFSDEANTFLLDFLNEYLGEKYDDYDDELDKFVNETFDDDFFSDELTEDQMNIEEIHRIANKSLNDTNVKKISYDGYKFLQGSDGTKLMNLLFEFKNSPKKMSEKFAKDYTKIVKDPKSVPVHIAAFAEILTNEKSQVIVSVKNILANGVGDFFIMPRLDLDSKELIKLYTGPLINEIGQGLMYKQSNSNVPAYDTYIDQLMEKHKLIKNTENIKGKDNFDNLINDIESYLKTLKDNKDANAEQKPDQGVEKKDDQNDNEKSEIENKDFSAQDTADELNAEDEKKSKEKNQDLYSSSDNPAERENKNSEKADDADITKDEKNLFDDEKLSEDKANGKNGKGENISPPDSELPPQDNEAGPEK